MAADIRVSRVYDAPGPGDGVRVLVDRVWPRGLRKTDAKLDEWAKDRPHPRPSAPGAGMTRRTSTSSGVATLPN